MTPVLPITKLPKHSAKNFKDRLRTVQLLIGISPSTRYTYLSPSRIRILPGLKTNFIRTTMEKKRYHIGIWSEVTLLYLYSAMADRAIATSDIQSRKLLNRKFSCFARSPPHVAFQKCHDLTTKIQLLYAVTTYVEHCKDHRPHLQG